MIVPGANILKMAERLVSTQSFVYNRFKERETNGIGYDVATYYPPVAVRGSIQPIQRALYAQMGLDLQKNYYNIYLSKGIVDIRRDTSGDQFDFNCKKYQVLSITDWYAMDGWDQVLVVEVPSA